MEWVEGPLPQEKTSVLDSQCHWKADPTIYLSTYNTELTKRKETGYDQMYKLFITRTIKRVFFDTDFSTEKIPFSRLFFTSFQYSFLAFSIHFFVFSLTLVLWRHVVICLVMLITTVNWWKCEICNEKYLPQPRSETRANFMTLIFAPLASLVSQIICHEKALV
mgnify:CR=1 FL=1